MMRALHPDFRDFLSCFNSSGVRYLLLGGYAVNFYGHHRNTKDIDLWIAISPDNAQRVASALQSFGFSPINASPQQFLQRGIAHSFGREPLRVDILSTPSGVEFDSCWDRRIDADFDGIRVPVIALDDLLANKTASARPRDVADVGELNRLRVAAEKGRKRRRNKR